MVLEIKNEDAATVVMYKMSSHGGWPVDLIACAAPAACPSLILSFVGHDPTATSRGDQSPLCGAKPENIYSV
jgi:hypothetical protein